MHELSLVTEIVRIASESAGEARIRRIVLEVGKLAAVQPDALRFCFQLAAEHTPAEGAVLEIIDVPGRATCRGCGRAVLLETPWDRCACGASGLEWTSGEELRIKQMEVV